MNLSLAGVLFLILSPIALIAFIALGVRRLKSGDVTGPVQGRSVRRFFQYGLLYGLLIVSASGLSGLLGRAFQISSSVPINQSDLARNLSYAVVGVPLYIGLAFWTRRKFAEDATEANSVGWGLYVGLSSVTALIVGMFALHDLVSWAFRINEYRGIASARLIVWGAVWGMHWWIHNRAIRSRFTEIHHMLGSLISLATVAIGLDQMVSGLLQKIWDSGPESIFLSQSDPILGGVVTLVVGIPIWFLYWTKNYSKAIKSLLWYGYVLLIGVAGGLITLMVALSAALYSCLVWLIGDTGSLTASSHFRDMPSIISAAIVGIILYAYHRGLLRDDRVRKRTEEQRVYEYLMSGIGLLAGSAGLAMFLVALLALVTRSSNMQGSGGKNALLASITLLLIGSPVWWVYWQRIKSAIRILPQEERGSITRRVYLFILFGLGGIVAVVTLLVGVFDLFDDIFKGSFGVETIRRMRFAMSILVTTVAIAGYHWAIYRKERGREELKAHGPRYVLLVGEKDPELKQVVSTFTGGHVQFWSRLDGEASAWRHDQVIQALSHLVSESVIVICEAEGGIRVIPVQREN